MAYTSVLVLHFEQKLNNLDPENNLTFIKVS